MTASPTKSPVTPVPAAVPATVTLAKPQPQAADGRSALLALLKVEADARDAKTTKELTFQMVNDIRKLTRARQVFQLIPGLTGALEVTGVSSLASVDRNAPLVIFIERLVAAADAKVKTETVPLDLALVAGDETAAAYPFRSLLWVPLKHGAGAPIGGLVLAREDQWSNSDLVIANRLASAFTHAWRALSAPKPRLTKALLPAKRVTAVASLLAALLLTLIHVPLTALAPSEIVAQDPFIVAAPIDGVIDSIAVEPNQPVKAGDLLVTLNDTTLKSRFEVAERDASVAEARLKQANQVAFSDPRGMHDLGIARAELEVKFAERDFAREMLAKTRISAAKPGLAIYSDKRELTGRPIAVGERILEIADPERLEVRIELPVADAIALTPGASAKVFLDSDPLRPWKATIKRSDYKARVGETEVVSFRVIATLVPEAGRSLPRLGVRGTSQVSGDDVPLGFYLFRRPITAFRQWTGL